MLRLRSHSFSFFSYGLKAKARAKDFLHIAFHLLCSEFETRSTASACCHIALHLLYSEFEIQTQRLLVAILLFICCTRNLKLDQQHLLVAIMLFICCTRNLKFKHSICLLPYCSSFVVLEIWNSNTASACCHIAFHLLHSKFEIQTQRLLVAILLFICCTRNFGCAAGNGKQMKISNGLLTCCNNTESRLYIISMI